MLVVMNFSLKYFSFAFLSVFLIFSKGSQGLPFNEEGDSRAHSAAISHSSTPKSIQAAHLSTPEEHNQFLIRALCNARNTVMISTYSLSSHKIFGEDIYEALDAAASRGVKIYIYYRNKGYLTEAEERRLSRVCNFQRIDNHSKCVIQDHTKVAIGSFNWLSETDERSINRSFVMSGLSARKLIEDVWQGVRFYNSLEYGNNAGIDRFLQDPDVLSTGAYEFSPGEFYYTLRSPDAHLQLLEQEVFSKAQKEILICSPFIRFSKLQCILHDRLMSSLEERGVRFHLFTLYEPCKIFGPSEKDRIFEYLRRLTQRYNHFSYSLQENLHAKTIIADDLLCEGSFNLLSAVDYIEHEANNFEMSVAIRGRITEPYIRAFRESPLGESVLPLDFFGTLPSYGDSSASASSSSSASASSSSSAVASQPWTTRPQQGDAITPPGSASRLTPQHFFQASPIRAWDEPNIQVFSGFRFNRPGFCVRLNGNYICDPRRAIIYFRTQREAENEACRQWNVGNFSSSDEDI